MRRQRSRIYVLAVVLLALSALLGGLLLSDARNAPLDGLLERAGQAAQTLLGRITAAEEGAAASGWSQAMQPVLRWVRDTIGLGNAAEGPPLKIAFVGSIGEGPGARHTTVLEGARMRVEEINANGGIAGRPLELVAFDDGGDPAVASEIADSIGRDEEILAVIGHGSSSASIAAAEVYRLYETPAVAPTSTNPNLTQFNPYYFRVIFNDNLQARIIANYIRLVLEFESVAVISDRSTYARTLLRMFRRTADDIGLNVDPIFTLRGDEDEAALADIARRLSLMSRLDAVLLVLPPDKAAEIIPRLRRAGVQADFIGSDSLTAQTTGPPEEGGAALPRYLDGVLLAVPFLLETASLGARRFIADFSARYGRPANWPALFGYDSALVIGEAMDRIDPAIVGDGGPAARAAIQQELAAMREPESGTEGLSGPIYFDQEGDIVRPVFLGRVERGKLVTARQQLRLVNDRDQVVLLREQGENTIEFDETFLQVTQVVGTGIEVRSITDIDETAQTFRAAFDLWLRYTGSFEASKLRFPFAVEPIVLAEPVRTITANRETYEVYEIDAVFRYELGAEALLRSEQDFVLTYAHADRDLTRLVLIPDLRAMGASAARASWADQLRANGVIDAGLGWVVDSAAVSQEVVNRSTLGNPLIPSVEIPYSAFQATIEGRRAEVSLRRAARFAMPEHRSWLALGAIATVLLLTLMLPAVRRLRAVVLLPLWILLSAAFLLMLEDLVVEAVRDDLEVYQLDALAKAFAALWWIVPALWLIFVVRRFVWDPIERRTGIGIPGIAKTLIDLVILLFAVMSVVSFVFGAGLTSLWAASGAATLVIGFAIQSLILDAFAGLMIAMERPFVTNHWIRVSHRFVEPIEGRVVDTNWRSTRLWVRDNNVVSIPNSMIAQATVVNLTQPTIATRLFVPVVLDHDVAVDEALAALTECAQIVTARTKGLLDDPPPRAIVKEIGDNGIVYFVAVHRDAATSEDAAVTAVVAGVFEELRARKLRPSTPRERITFERSGASDPALPVSSRTAA